MTPLIFLLLGIAGGLGAGTRYLLDTFLKARLKTAFSWSTTIINVTGSLVLGFITGLTAGDILSSDVSVIMGTGFLGGYTTFSTASYETVQLVKEKKYGFALLSGVGMLLMCVAVAWLGLWLGKQV